MHAVLVHLLASAALTAATPPPGPDPRDPARVFIDCAACDETHLRTEVTFVDHVRDRQVADVHVLVTTQETGAGGTEYTAQFIGQGRFEGIDQTLRISTGATETLDARRERIARMVKLGLVRYAAETALGAKLQVTFEDASRPEVDADRRDPWNAWVFRTGFSGQLLGQTATASTSFDLFFNANRTTESWKIDARVDGDYGEQRFELDEGETFTTSSYGATARATVARSLTEHWSLGLMAHAGTSTFQNYRLRTRVGPGIEYNVFPYSESTHRILTVLYTVGLQTFAYREETLFGRISERLPDHRVGVTLGLLQPWGTASASVGATQFLTARDKYRLSAQAMLELRLFKGLSMDVFGRVARRRDQINLPRGSATDEQILVRQRELATDYEYDLNIGFSYSFGSIFNNVVNPRYRGAEEL